MAKKSTKKTVVTTSKEKSTLQPTMSKTSTASASRAVSSDLLFGEQNYIYIIGAFSLVLLGMLLMAGGKQLPTEWNENEIYSFRRTVIAPVVILAGLAVGVYAIFTKK